MSNKYWKNRTRKLLNILEGMAIAIVVTSAIAIANFHMTYVAPLIVGCIGFYLCFLWERRWGLMDEDE